MKTLPLVSVALLLLLAAAGPAARPLTSHNERRIAQLLHDGKISPRNEGAAIAATRAAMPAQDRRIGAYLAAHADLPDKVRDAVAECRPCPGMPEELLLLLGRGAAPESESETGWRGEWWPYGFAGPSDLRYVYVRGGRVSTVQPLPPAGEYVWSVPK